MNKIAKLLTSSLLVIALLSGFAMAATTTINFETENSGYSASATEGSGITDVFNRTNTSYGGNTSYYWACEDISLSNPSLTLSSIDITGQTTLSFSVDFFTRNSNDWDDNDELLITYSIDGGADQNLMWVQNTGEQYNDPAALDLAFDGDGDVGEELPANTDGASAGVGNTFETFSNNNISISGSSLVIKFQFNGLTSADESIYIDNIIITTAAGSSPVITVSESSLSDFSYVEGSGPSAEQSYTVSGSDLTADITVTPPTNYEISTGTGGSFVATSPITLTQAGGSVAETTIYVRLKSGLADANYNSETIVASSTGATSQNVTCSGTVWEVEPATHVTDFAEDTKTASTVTLTWTTNGSDGYVVTANGNTPVDGTELSDIDGQEVVGATGTATVEGLTASTAYTFKIYPFNNSGAAVDYKTDGVVPSVTVTTDAAPASGTIIISQYYEGAGNNKWIEITNTGNAAVDVSDYYIARWSGTSTPSGAPTNSSAFSDFSISSMAAGEVILMQNSSSVLPAYASGNSTTACYFNGDDPVAITSGSTDWGNRIDCIYASGTWGENTSFYRNSNILTGNTNISDLSGSGEWTEVTNATVDGASSENSEYLGTHVYYGGATPITLASFTATAKAGVVELTWETASETNNASFVIYRNNEVLATIEGAGTTSETNTYVYTDATVVPGVTYTYVLADVDYANNETRYDDKAVTVELANDVAEADFVIGAAYPNPFNPTAIIPVNLTRDAVVEAKVYTLTGREIATIANESMSAGSHDLRITSDNMTTGLYLVKVVVEDMVNVQKIAFVK